jgi:hypothetical protein
MRVFAARFVAPVFIERFLLSVYVKYFLSITNPDPHRLYYI